MPRMRSWPFVQGVVCDRNSWLLAVILGDAACAYVRGQCEFLTIFDRVDERSFCISLRVVGFRASSPVDLRPGRLEASQSSWRRQVGLLTACCLVVGVLEVSVATCTNAPKGLSSMGMSWLPGRARAAQQLKLKASMPDHRCLPFAWGVSPS